MKVTFVVFVILIVICIAAAWFEIVENRYFITFVFVLLAAIGSLLLPMLLDK